MNTWKSKSAATRALQTVFILGLTVFLTVSCSDMFNGGSQQQGQSRMNFHLTDAPGDYQEVNIDVQGLRIHYTPAETDTSDSTSDSNGEWIDLPIEPTTVDLLTLQNGVDTLLASADLEPGYYQELRLMLGNDNYVMIDSTEHYMKVPSGQSSGYKVKFHTNLEEGEQVDVTIDFDASRSVHKAGNSGKYMLKPVLRAYVTTGDSVETGSIAGIVEPLEAEPSVLAIMGDDTVATTEPDTTGSFMMEGLDEGTYDLHVKAGNQDYNDEIMEDVAVQAGEETNVGTITLEQNQ